MEKNFSMEEFISNVDKTYNNSIDEYSMAIRGIKEKAMRAKEQEIKKKRSNKTVSKETISKKTLSAEEKDDLVLE